MIYDLNENPKPENQTTDIVIMGGGIAGIYLALKLGRAGKKIAQCKFMTNLTRFPNQPYRR